MMTFYIVGLRTSCLLLNLLYVCQIFFPSVIWRMKFLIKDFSRTMQARIVIFGSLVHDALLYPGLGTSRLLLILPCICPIFFPSILWRMTFFSKDFSTAMHTRMLIFGMQIYDDVLSWDWEQSFSCLFFLYLSIFLSFLTLNNEISQHRCSATMQAGISIFAILVHSCCTVGLRISLLLLILPCICLSFSPYFE